VLREEVPPVNASHGSFENPRGRFVLRSFRQGGVRSDVAATAVDGVPGGHVERCGFGDA